MNTQPNPVIQDQDLLQLRKAAVLLKALDHPLRQQILRFLHDHHKLTVTELFIKLRMEQPVVSQHLSMMRSAGLVTTHKQGKFVWYSVDYPGVEKMGEIARRLAETAF